MPNSDNDIKVTRVTINDIKKPIAKTTTSDVINEPKSEKPTNNKARKRKFNKKTIQNICVFSSAIAVIAIMAILLNMFRQPIVNDEYFVSDDTKEVVSLNASGNSSSSRTFIVYSYSGEEVTGLKTYFEYEDEESAKAALQLLKDQPEFKNAELEGKYIVVTADESQFKGLTASDVKQQNEALKKFQQSR